MIARAIKPLAVVLFATAVMFGQAATTMPATGSADVAGQIRQLQQALQVQQQQIQKQQDQIDTLQKKLREKEAAQQVVHPLSLGEVASTTPVLPAAAPAPAAEPQAGPMGQPRKPDAIELAEGKIKLNFVGYGSWGIYPETGYGPQFVTQTSYPGPGNDNFNSFDITRTYINFLYIPNKHLTIRATPNLYITSDGSHTVRMKYAYAELNNLFEGSDAFKDDNIRLGMQMNPLVDWEEGLYGYRFVSLTPWNFLTLSSTQIGVSMNGPIKRNGKQYLDYQIGAFNNGSFHDVEKSSEKQGMARLSFYPFGASSKYDGLGLTGFVDYGTANIYPNTPTYPMARVAALAHYTSKHNGASLAFEYDWGRNAFDAKHLFSSGTTPSGADAYLASLAGTLLNPGVTMDTKQRGYDLFGHVNIPNSKFGFFGMFQNFQPNTLVGKDPFDFNRLVAGVAYKVNGHLRFAFDNQDILYTHSQFTFTAADSGGVYAGPDVANAVPKNTKALFVNMELTF